MYVLNTFLGICIKISFFNYLKLLTFMCCKAQSLAVRESGHAITTFSRAEVKRLDHQEIKNLNMTKTQCNLPTLIFAKCCLSFLTSQSSGCLITATENERQGFQIKLSSLPCFPLLKIRIWKLLHKLIDCYCYISFLTILSTILVNIYR